MAPVPKINFARHISLIYRSAISILYWTADKRFGYIVSSAKILKRLFFAGARL